MQRLKKVNLLFCLVFSFIFLFGSVFSVQAEDFTRERQSLVLPLGPEGFADERVKCIVDYTTQNIGEYAEKKIIRSIDKTSFSARDPFDECDYKFGNVHTEISEDKGSALIHVTVTRILCSTKCELEFDLTFELKVN